VGDSTRLAAFCQRSCSGRADAAFMIAVTSPGMSAVRRLAVGRGLSSLGTFAAYVALSLSLWEQTHSALVQTVGMVLTWGMFGPAAAVAGPWADRFDRRRLMILADAGAAVCAAAMVLWHTPTGLLVLGGLLVWAFSPYYPAYGGALPNLVADPEELNRASGWIGVGRNIGILVGPVLGGILYAGVGAGWVFALNALSYAAGALLTASIRLPFQTWESGRSRAEGGGWRTGLAVIRGSRVLTTLMATWMVILLTFEGANVVFAPFSEQMHASRFAYGLALALWGGGMVAGALLATRLTRRTEIAGLLAGVLLIMLGTLGWTLAPSWDAVLVATGIAGVGNGLCLATDGAIFMRRTPDEARGRASAVYEGAGSACSFAGYVLGGLALSLVPPQAFFVMATLGALVGAAMVARLLPRSLVDVAGDAPLSDPAAA
jgi:MFS family permease